METIEIKDKTWRKIIQKSTLLEKEISRLKKLEQPSEKWLDNQDVCLMLNISKRTLQTYRNNGTLAHSKINHKIYYRPKDLKSLIKKLTQK